MDPSNVGDEKVKRALSDKDSNDLVVHTQDDGTPASDSLHGDAEAQKGVKPIVDRDLEKRLANPLKLLSESH